MIYLHRQKNVESNFGHRGKNSLCNLCVLCVSVVVETRDTTTTESQRTQRLHREIQIKTPLQMIARIKNLPPLRYFGKFFSAPRAENDYATHVPILIGLARMREIRNVLEFGCGR